jgi:S-DNA-T family DNA segregation ATPase FtsK/SpoIIIE
MSKTTVKAGFFTWILNGLFSIAGWIIVAIAKLLLKAGAKLGAFAVRQLIGHPRSSIGMSLVSGAVILVGWQIIAAIIGAVLLSGSVWKAAHKASFEASVQTWMRTWLRKWGTYRRRWEDVMTRCGLSVEVQGETHLPKLKKVRTTEYWDSLALKIQVGQEMGDFEKAGEKLRTAFQVERLAVREIEPGMVGVELMKKDPFRHEEIGATAMPGFTADIDFTAIPVGLDEHLEPLTVSVVGGHTAGSGTSGAGKAGVEWNILRGLAPAIADGTVRPIFIDPKGVELRQGIDLCDHGTFGTTKDNGWVHSGDYAVSEQDTISLLQRIVAEIEEVKMARGELGGERDFVPSVRTPLRPIFIDELAPLLAYWPRREREKIEDALGIILTQGRALGYIVIGLIQEPTKDVFTMRDLFGHRLGLRLPTEAHTDAALTEKASDRGAECNKIPQSLPGVLFSFHEKDSKAIRARLGYVTDDDIAELVEYVEALRKVTSIAPVEQLAEVEYIDEDDAGELIEDDGEAAA